jgi:hypothetical protein
MIKEDFKGKEEIKGNCRYERFNIMICVKTVK